MGGSTCAAADDGIYDFLYAAAPLNIEGGAGAPVNPVVIKASTPGRGGDPGRGHGDDEGDDRSGDSGNGRGGHSEDGADD